MSTEYEQLSAMRSLSLGQLAELRADPKPSYSLGGQQV